MTQERNCENCAHADCQVYEYPCNVCEISCDHPPTKWESEDKPQTNADLIRIMTDEELAETLNHSCPQTGHFRERCNVRKVTCHDCWFAWLQQPYKENEDE